MAKSAMLALRVSPEVREALTVAAAEDDRSVSNLVERILSMWLREKGYLAQAAE
ncbi:hypothetical protein [Roseomonas indoligenes]|uniref:Ribbon-helix-helix protein CopG domain-containing protein n=1 Tax=Roseomonas indoligenes TaxID=2820811 RepID=A0A940MZF8_9PROT|nr:hypothetical protein [Pararoseomonas indoligenes]MBP0493997.1 hypothetical protein [Pararoseomonas indoligenes]